jgi:predicted metal-dependent enzyme (double-stranded beta helix superfamily)
VPDGTIHTVEALDGVDAVSIHVYGTDIVTQERSTFDLATGREDIYRPEFTEADGTPR